MLTPPNVIVHCWRTRIGVVLLALTVAFSWSAEPAIPQFSGYIGFAATDTLFALRWSNSTGGSYQTWVRIGERAGDFKVVEFDSQTTTLSVEDRSGRIHRLTLPEGKVRTEDHLTDQEFSDLFKYVLQGADVAGAPVLSREKARAFYLQLILKWVPPDVEVIFDMDGLTLAPDVQAKWAESKTRARAADRLLLAVVVNGKTELHEFPRRGHAVPEQMTRNLIESDWDEFALLQATNTLKRRIADASNGLK
jgi:hypothetical protein